MSVSQTSNIVKNTTDFNIDLLSLLPSLNVGQLVETGRLKRFIFTSGDYSSDEANSEVRVPNQECPIRNFIDGVCDCGSYLIGGLLNTHSLPNDTELCIQSLMNNTKCVGNTLQDKIKFELLNFAQLFLVAHEVSHIFLKHSSHAGQWLHRYGYNLNEARKQIEFDADRNAILCFLSDISVDKLPIALTGAFCGQFAYWFKDKRLGPVDVNKSYHPDKDTRMAAIIQLLPDNHKALMTQFVLAMVNKWLSENNCDNMYRPMNESDIWVKLELYKSNEEH